MLEKPQSRRRHCIGWLICMWLISASYATSAESLVDMEVTTFEFHGRNQVRHHIGGADSIGELPEAATCLAWHTEIGICIEEVPRGPTTQPVPIEISLQDTTVGAILREMVRQDPRYKFRERFGLVEVLPVGAEEDPMDCLNLRIPLLRVHYPWRIAWGQVRCAIQITSRNPADVVPDPREAGRCWGSSILVHPPETVLKTTFENQTVRDILDQLSSLAGNVAWSAYFDGNWPTCDNLRLSEYQPRSWYPTDPDHPEPGKEREGLPPNCAGCHYHRGSPRR
jgi:hypothetical protein